jgi:UDP-glucose 4-epimerase
LKDEAIGKLYNIGNTEEISMNGLAERVRDLAGSNSSITLTPYTEAYGPGFEDMQRRVPDISRINALIGWNPTRSLDDILLAVIEDKKNSDNE